MKTTSSCELDHQERDYPFYNILKVGIDQLMSIKLALPKSKELCGYKLN